MSQFIAQVKCLEQLEDGTYTDKFVELPEQEFKTLAEAEAYARMESTGLKGATWEVRADLPPYKACSTVAASRNRTLFLQLQITAYATKGTSGEENRDYWVDKSAYLELKAPQICKALHSVFKDSYETEDYTVRVYVTDKMMFVG